MKEYPLENEVRACAGPPKGDLVEGSSAAIDDIGKGSAANAM